MRRTAVFAAISVAHFVLNEGATILGGGAIMAAFDGHGSTLAASAGGLMMAILNFPLLHLPVPHGLGTIAEYLLLVLNSMLWGAAGVAIWCRLTSWRRRAVQGGG